MHLEEAVGLIGNRLGGLRSSGVHSGLGGVTGRHKDVLRGTKG